MNLVHFIDVGLGNMVAIIFSDGKVLFYDCNLTEDNNNNIFTYLKKIMPKNEIDVFINSHRDADHMRGIKSLHKKYPIKELWDSGVSGNTNTPEYEEYMDFRRSVNVQEVKPNQYYKNLKILNGKREGLDNQNAQSIVVHLDNNGASIILTGDTDAKAWKYYIVPESASNLKSTFLLASHHGSISFFDDSDDEKYYYAKHIGMIKPSVTIISVGKNSYGLPDKKALEFYEKYSTGTDKGDKIFQTDKHGNIRIELKDDGGSSIFYNQ